MRVAEYAGCALCAVVLSVALSQSAEVPLNGFAADTYQPAEVSRLRIGWWSIWSKGAPAAPEQHNELYYVAVDGVH